MYRWKVEGNFTCWAMYKKFKNKSKFENEIAKLKLMTSDFVEYRAA